MFHSYNYDQSSFQDWLRATHQLHKSQYLELRESEESLAPLGLEATSQDQFLLYIDDEVGLCGSAAIMALPYDLEINFQIVPQGTWVLRNVFFHINDGHPLQKQPERISRIIVQFYQGLFEHVWQLASQSNHQSVLSLQNQRITHDELEFFGGFTFGTEMIEDDKDICVALGVMSLTPSTYDSFRHRGEI